MLILRIFLPFAMGYFLSFFYRSINAIIGPKLIDEVALSPTSLGLMTSAYFLTFALFQIPLGVLLDRYGARRVQATLFAVSACGALLFSIGESLTTLTVARALIGLGMAGALMAAFSTFVQWFPAHQLPWLNGCFLAFGGLGALTATVPVEVALEVMEWRNLFLWLGLLTFLVAVTIFLAVPEAESQQEAATQPGWWTLLRGLKDIYGSGFFWSIAPLSCACLSSAFAIQGLWAGLWLQDISGFSSGAAAAHLMVIAIGLTLGSVLSGTIVQLMSRLGLDIVAAFAVCCALFVGVQIMIILVPDRSTWLLWFFFGFLINQAALAYAILSRHFPKEWSGRANTCLNLFVVGGAFVVQYSMGWIIDFFLAQPAANMTVFAYRVSFTMVVALQIAGLAILLIRLRRTRGALR